MYMYMYMYVYTLVPWYPGTLVPWYPGTLVPTWELVPASEPEALYQFQRWIQSPPYALKKLQCGFINPKVGLIKSTTNIKQTKPYMALGKL